MTSAPRPRRPNLDREEPQRGFEGVFGARPGAGDGDGDGARAGVEDDVARGVGTGYRLIEEYLRRGQEVARSMWAPRAPFSSGQAAFTPGPERMLEYTAQVVSLWFDMVRSAWPQAESGDSPGAPGGFDFAAHGPPPRAGVETERRSFVPLVSLAIESAVPLEVTVDLRSDCQGKRLIAFDLRARDPESPRLGGVELVWVDERRVRVGLRVPEHQPPGTYTGVVVDEATNLPEGTITVAIGSQGDGVS